MCISHTWYAEMEQVETLTSPNLNYGYTDGLVDEQGS